MSNQRLPEVQLFPTASVTHAPFLKGPIPLWWLEGAGKLPGKALHVGISLWFLSGVTKSDTVRFNQCQQERYGVKRDAARRAIQALEKANLIAVNRGCGKRQEVTIIRMSNLANSEPEITTPPQGSNEKTNPGCGRVSESKNENK